MMVSQIPNHKEIAKDRLRQQYKNLPLLEGFMDAFVEQIQQLEQVYIDLRDDRTIFNAEGVNLDAWGRLLNTPRNGLDDTAYRLILLGQIAVNVSKGTPEDLIQVFRLFTSPTYVSLNESYPANVQLTAVGGAPIGDVDAIKNAIKRAAPAGVSIDLFTTAPGNPFVFLSDPDPNGRGFGDFNDADVGGFLVSIF